MVLPNAWCRRIVSGNCMPPRPPAPTGLWSCAGQHTGDATPESHGTTHAVRGLPNADPIAEGKREQLSPLLGKALFAHDTKIKIAAASSDPDGSGTPVFSWFHAFDTIPALHE